MEKAYPCFRCSGMEAGPKSQCPDESREKMHDRWGHRLNNRSMLKKNWTEVLRTLKQKTMLVNLLLGFSGGLPFLLKGKTLQTWMFEDHVDLTVVGAYALVGLPYTLKFLWSPLMDRFTPFKLGRRRSWLLISQIGVIAILIVMSFMRPTDDLALFGAMALLLAFFGASQDIVIDAYRRESLEDEELGIGSSYYAYGYRVAILISGAVSLSLATYIPWGMVYQIMAVTMLIGVATTLWSDEPVVDAPQPRTLQESVVMPLKEFLSRSNAYKILLFILLYKVGDAIAGNMTQLFYLDIGFSKNEIAAIAKTLGVFSNMAGALVGGISLMRLGINRSLWVFGIFQALSTLSFCILNYTGHNNVALGGVIIFEDMSAGMGSAAFMAYMASMANKSFTATQYALMTSLMGVPMTIIASPAGEMVKLLGWNGFFVACTVAAIPGLLLLRWMTKDENVRI